MTASKRIRENVPGWLFLVGAYAGAIVITMAATLHVDLQLRDFAASLMLAAVSTLVFLVFSAGILFRHRRARPRTVFVTGTIVGTLVYLLTWLIWQSIEPSFRHAVPIELLPMFALPILGGLVVGVGLYFASIEQPPN